MKPEERQKIVAEMVGREGRLTVELLASRFGVSTETIRRDLAVLAETGAVKKVHGGARAVRLQAEGSFEERMAEDAAGKRVIAGKLAALVQPGEVLFIDTGSTTLACAEALTQVPRLTVVTNSIHVARALGRPGGARVLLLGGSYGHGNAQTTGAETLRQIASFRADRAILTPAGVDPEAGIVDADLDEAQVARAMHEHARGTVVVAASSKFNRSSAFRVCPLAEIDLLITDNAPQGELASALAMAGVETR